MKIIIWCGCLYSGLALVPLGGELWAQQGGARRPIREHPAGDAGVAAAPVAGADSEEKGRAQALRGVAGEAVDMADTLFLPADTDIEQRGDRIPGAAPDGPVDAPTIQLAAAAPEGEQLELMQVYEGLKQFDNAIAAASLVLARDPGNREALAGMSRLMVETGRSQEGIQFADKLLALDPGMEGQALKASALISASRAEEAEVLLRQMKASYRGAGPFPNETLLGFVSLEQGRKKEARAIFEAIESGVGFDAIEVDTASKQLLLLDLDRALVWRDRGAAGVAVAALRDDYPGEPETAAAEAVEQFLGGDVSAATVRLQALRSSFPRLRLYPFLVQLADFSYEAGEFETAESAYAEALADPRTRPLAREAVVRNRAQMRVREGEQVIGDFAVSSGDEGSLATSQLEIRKGVGNGWYLGGRFVRQDMDLDGAGSGIGSDERMQGSLLAERRLGRRHYAEAELGGSDAGVMGGVRLGRRARVYADAWTIGIAANERANDSARLAALDGRQHRVSGLYQREITPRFVLTAGAIVRQVEVDGGKFGRGGGGEIDLAYRLNEEERRSNYFIAWRSNYEKFERTRDDLPSDASEADQLTSGLIQPEYGRHGIELRHEGQWQEVLFTRAMAGIYYRADSSDIEASGGLGFDWFFDEHMRLFLDVLYTSNGEAANAGSGVIEAKLGVAKSF